MGLAGLSGLRALRFVWLVAALLAALAGCSSGDGATPSSFGTGDLGDACQKTEDCASGICVRVDASGGICSVTCKADMNCPAADNWACLDSDDGSMLRVCACRKLSETEVCDDGIDNDCNGKVDDCRVCDGRSVPQDDPENCGACGNACLPEQSCKNGQCSCPKEATTACAGSCADLQSDSENCGACGVSCGAGRKCDAGACACADASTDYCSGTGCVSLKTDSNNCGTCGKACTLGQACQAGSCACPATDAPDFCDAVGCVDLQTDPKNCGTCGTACASGFACSAGECSCASGQSDCAGACVDTQTSAANCGACGAACGSAEACSAGSCGCTSFGYTVCGDTCADTSSDVNHCGSCDKACGSGEVCTGGKCACPSGIYCNDVCIVASSDSQNCGACGHACGPTQSCVSGQCRCDGFGLSACGSACVAEQTDTTNCGSCSTTCPTGESCNSGSCGCSAAGQTYCPANAACTLLGSDPKNCGACGTVCATTEVCSLGICQCPLQGQKYCAAQNKCLDTLSDTQNCGACGKACNAGQVCSGGVCSCPTSGQLYCASAGACIDTLGNTADCGACDNKCPTTETCSTGKCQCPTFGQTFCANANACVPLASDGNNCGACGNKCPAATHCASSCQCDTAGLTLCGNVCDNLQTDPAHCGSCSNACGGKLSCVTGHCQCLDPTVGTALRLTTDTLDQFYLSAAWDGTHVGLAYCQSDPVSTGGFLTNVRFSLLNPDGTRVSDIAISSAAGGYDQVQCHPTLVWTGTEYGLVWNQTITFQSQILLVRLGADGKPKGAAVPVTPLSDLTSFTGSGLSWSSTYGGYAISSSLSTNEAVPQVMFGRIGPTGTTLDPENSFVMTGDTQWATPIAAAATGGWAIASQYDATVRLAAIDASGARTAPLQLIQPPNQFGYGLSSSGGPWLLYDGVGWLTGYVGPDIQGIPGLFVNRGAAANSPVAIQPATSAVYVSDAAFAMVNGTVAVGFTEAPFNNGSGTNGAKFRLQRYSFSGTSSTLTPLHNVVDVVPTYTITPDQYGDIQLVATGAQSLLGLWVDNRWGSAHELYAAPIDLHNCP